MMFARLLDRAVEMLEEKVLRVGGNHFQLWLLMGGYGMFLSTHEPERTDIHWQICVDRMTFLVCKGLGREEQVWHLKTAPELAIPHGMENLIPDEVSNAYLKSHD
jgi:hypothetical protein